MVNNGSVEWSLRAFASRGGGCEQCVYFGVRLLSCEQRALKEIQMASSEQFANFSSSRNLDLSSIGKKAFAPSNLTDTVQTIPAASQLCLVGCRIT